MYDVQLTESLFAAEVDDSVREITIGDLLREVAAEHPSAPALIEVKPEGDTGRRWTYLELLSDSEKLALALSTISIEDMSYGCCSRDSSKATSIVGTPRSVLTFSCSIKRVTTKGSNNMTSNIVQAACKHPSDPMPQPDVWNIGIMFAQTVFWCVCARPA